MEAVRKAVKAPRADADETRAAIVDAAISLFAARGYDGVRFRDVAESAGRPLGVVSYHFPSKDTLWQASALAIHEDFATHFGDRYFESAGQHRSERAREMLRAYIRYFARDPRLFRFMIQVSMTDDERLRWYVATLGNPFRKRFADLFDEMADRNDIPVSDDRFAVLLYSLLGAATLIYATAPEVLLTQGVDPERDDLVETHIDLLIERFLPLA